MEKFERKKSVNVGTIGHVDHGKSTLCHLLASLESEINKDRSPIMEIVLRQSHFDPDCLPYTLFEKKGRRRAQRKQQRGF